MCNERLLIREWLDCTKFLARVVELVGPYFKSKCCSSKSSMVSEGCDTASSLVLQELEIEKGSTSAGESAKDSFPSLLILEDVEEGDVGVLERDYNNISLWSA